MKKDNKNIKKDNELSFWRVFKILILYYKPYKLILLLDIICALIVAMVDLIFPQILRSVIADFGNMDSSGILNSLGLLALILVSLYLIRTSCKYYIARWGHIMGASMESDMRQDLFGHYEKLSFSYFDQHNSGEMGSKILTDLFDISEFAHHGPENFLICVLLIVGSFILLFSCNVPLAALMLVATIIMTIYSVYVNYKRRVVFTANRKKMAKMNAQIQDSLGGIKTVKSFSNEKEEILKFLRINNKYLDTKKESYLFIANFNAASSLFQGVLYTLVIIGGGYFVATNQMNVADMAIFALYVGIFISPIEQLIQFSETFQKGYAGFKRFVEVLITDPDVVESENAIDFPKDIKIDIEYKDVVFNYKSDNKDSKLVTLNKLNLKVKEGESVALVGPSGEGKSTTCALLPRFYDLDSGKITIGGIDIRDLKFDALRKQIGFIHQESYIFAGTIADNISYGLKNVKFEDIVKAAKAADIHKSIMEKPDGYDTIVGERGSALSGGQKQRIAIARLFLRDPKIIILDEATSALDNLSERKVQNSLDKLCKGRTTIMIAHRLSTIKSADKIAVVHKGQVTEFGTHESLLKNPNSLYTKYYNLQFH